ncbi:MAG: TetR/AcrR family transcriptional regulator [Actinomycetota bacterium]
MTADPGRAADDARERVLGAAYECVARFGFAKTTMADVGRAAGLSRATVYRLFPGGRDELFAAMVAWEMDRFFARMAAAVGDAGDFAAVVEGALVFAHREIRAHAALQQVLATEPDRLLRFMTQQDARIRDAVVAYLRPRLDAEVAAGRVRPGIDLDDAARFVATMGLSLMSTPGRVDLEDPDVVHRLVRGELLGGILRAPGAAPSGPAGDR